KIKLDLKSPNSSGGVVFQSAILNAGASMKAGLLVLAVLAAWVALKSTAAAETIRFAIMRDGQPIGSNTIELQRNGAETTVRMVTHIQVKVAFLTVYRFDQTEAERWVDGRLVTLEAVTDDNGTPHRVRATSSNGKITVNADGKVSEIAGTTIPASYWNAALL